MGKDQAHDIRWMDRLTSSYGLGMAMSLGSRDGVNVFSLALTVLLLIYLIYFVRSKWDVLNLGLVAFSVQVLTATLMVQGKLDLILSLDWVFSVFIVFYWILGTAFVGLGLALFRDWTRLRADQTSGLWIKWPEEFDSSGAGQNMLARTIRFLSQGLIVSIYSVLTVMLGSIATNDYVMFLMVLEAQATQAVFEAQKLTFAYALPFAFPTFIVALLALIYRSSSSIRDKARQSMSMVKILCSAVLLSVGAGVIITLIYF